MQGRHHDRAPHSEEKKHHLGYLFYRYLKIIQARYPGLLAQWGTGILTRDKPGETAHNAQYTISAGRLFNKLEIIGPENETRYEALNTIEDTLHHALEHKSNREQLKQLNKTLQTIPPGLNKALIEKILTCRNQFIDDILEKYQPKIGKLLCDEIPDQIIRMKVRTLIFRSIFFYCYTHLFQKNIGKYSKKAKELKQRQSSLNEVNFYSGDNASDTLTNLQTEKKQALLHRLQTEAFNSLAQEKQFDQLAPHLTRLIAYLKDLRNTAEFKHMPHLVTNTLLDHLFNCAVVVNTAKAHNKEEIILDDTLHTLFEIISNFIESHHDLIRKEEVNQIKAEAILNYLMQTLPERKTLYALTRKISPKKNTDSDPLPTYHERPTVLSSASDDTSSSYSEYPTQQDDLKEEIPPIIPTRRPPVRLMPSITNLGIFQPPTQDHASRTTLSNTKNKKPTLRIP